MTAKNARRSPPREVIIDSTTQGLTGFESHHKMDIDRSYEINISNTDQTPK